MENDNFEKLIKHTKTKFPPFFNYINNFIKPEDKQNVLDRICFLLSDYNHNKIILKRLSRNDNTHSIYEYNSIKMKSEFYKTNIETSFLGKDKKTVYYFGFTVKN